MRAQDQREYRHRLEWCQRVRYQSAYLPPAPSIVPIFLVSPKHSLAEIQIFPSLEKFVSLPESVLEKREKLEQLRALEAGMRIDIALVDTIPDGVDTPADLERARARLEIQAKLGN